MTILLLTNRLDYTADFVVLELQHRRADYVRLNTEDIPTRVKINWSLSNQSDNYIDSTGRRIRLSDISAIWYRRPVAPVPASEITDSVARDFVIDEARAGFAGVWRTLKCLWISHPDKLFAASFKIVQLETAKALGFTVPETLVTNVGDEARSFLSGRQYSAVYKTLAGNKLERADGTQLIFTNQLKPQHGDLLSQVEYTPCLFQGLVEKAVDIRVTVIGNRAFAVAIDSQSLPETQIDWRRTAASSLSHTKLELPPDVEDRCLKLVSHFGLQFGAIDLVRDREGTYSFLEINGNGQWAWIEQLTGLPLAATLVDLLTQGHE